MIQLTNQAKAGGIPRLAMINSFAGFGRSSTAISLPVISALQVQVCPLPTSILSNHLGFPVAYKQDFTPYMQEYLQAWEALDLHFDGLYCGFLGSIAQIEIVKQLLKSPLMKSEAGKPLFLLDPVMADHGKFYATMTAEHCNCLKGLIAFADIITPNITEACLLTDTPYTDDTFHEDRLRSLCRSLEALADTEDAFVKASRHRNLRIVITGLRQEDCFLNYVWENGQGTAYCIKSAGQSRPGTGDLFASILAADALHEVPFQQSVKKASEFVALCIKGTEEAGIPPREGVLFEKYLSRLHA